MTRKMLQGYAMTSEFCPTCKNVLLRSRSGELECAYCAVATTPHPAPTAATSPIPTTAASTTTTTTTTSPLQTRSLSPPMPTSRPSSDEASARLGRLLLQGWRMLDAACGSCNTPLMSSRGSDALHCVLCGDVDRPPPRPSATTPPGGAPPHARQPDRSASISLREAVAAAEAAEAEADEADDQARRDAEDATLAASPTMRRAAEFSLRRAPPAPPSIQPQQQQQQQGWSNGANSSDTWAAALGEVHAGIAADAAGGPTARHLAPLPTTTTTPPILAAPPMGDEPRQQRVPLPPLHAARVMNAPVGWQTMSPEELQAYAEGRSAPAPVRVAAPQAAATASTPHIGSVASPSQPPPPRITQQPGLSPGSHVELDTASGNVGPSGAVVFLGSGKLEIPPPSQDLVARIEVGLARAAAEEENARRAIAAATTAASASTSSSSVSVRSPLALTTPVTASASGPPATPANTSSALNALSISLERENETVVRLAASFTASGGQDTEALAAAASRIARLVSGIAALRTLLG